MDNLKPLNALSLTGDIAENWKRWKQRWEIFSLASGCKDKAEDVQCAIFLHQIGDDTLNIYDSFTFSTTEKDKIAPLITKFDGHFNPKKNITFQRYLFNTCVQDGRSFDIFYVDITNKANNCEFGSLKDDLIKDRIVCGIDSKDLRERLLREDALTLTKAVAHVRACESSKAQVSNLQAGNNQPNNKYNADTISRTNNTYPQQFNNNYSMSRQLNNNSRGRGRYIQRVCNYCGTSHGRNSCPANIGNNEQNHQIETNLNYEGGDLNIEELYIDAVETVPFKYSKRNEIIKILNVNGDEIEFKIDTGAECNVLPLQIFNNMKAPPVIKKCDTTLRSYGGNKLNVIGICNMNICTPESSAMSEFYIVDNNNIKPLLGLTSCQVLKIIDIHHVSKVAPESQIINEYNEIFTGLGLVDGEYHIDYNKNCTPVVHAPRKIPLTLKPKLKLTLDRLAKAEVIRKVDKPTDWVNSMVIVEKKDGSLRICIDPKELNIQIKRQYRVIPTAEEISSQLHGKNIFTVIDMADCYWHIKLDEASADLCTFNTPFGRYRFNRMPFGISCASDAALIMIEKHFGDIDGVLAIHDDLIISASNTEEHDKILITVFQRAKDRNIKFNLKKIQFRVSEVKYLGNIVSSEGLRPDPDKVKAINEMPTPSCKQDVHRLLGMINYLGQFISNLSEITAPIRSLLKKDTHWSWSHEHEKALKRIKETQTKSPLLAYYDVNSPVTLQVDASSHGLGACLIQNSHPVTYSSRSLTSAEKNYSQLEKELLAIVFGCERFNQFVYGKEINVKSDHKPLESIIKKPLSSAPPRVQRLLVRLLKYDVRIQFIPGKFLHIADTLSRAPLPSTGDLNTIHDESILMIHTVIKNLSISAKKKEELQEAIRNDNNLQLVKQFIINGWPECRKDLPPKLYPYWQVRNDLHIIDEIIMKEWKVVIPESMVNYILNLLHTPHLGIEKTTARARKIVYWPGLSDDIYNMISKCNLCLKYCNKNQKQPLTSHPIPELPWQKVGSDLFDFDGKSYIVIIDYLSKFIEFSVIKDKSAPTVIAYMKSVFTRHGIPQEMVADNVPYNSREFDNFAKSYGFSVNTSSPRYPQSNGMSEMGVKISKRILKKCNDPHLGLLEYLNTPITGMSYSPAQMLMSRTTRSIMPTSNHLLQPVVAKDAISQNVKNKVKQKYYFDRNAKVLPTLKKDDNVRIHKDGVWKRAVVTEMASAPQSFHVLTERGNILRRNRRDLLKTMETEPLIRNDLNLPEDIPASDYIQPQSIINETNDYSQDTQLVNRAEDNSIANDNENNEINNNNTNSEALLPVTNIPVGRPRRTVKKPSYLDDYVTS